MNSADKTAVDNNVIKYYTQNIYTKIIFQKRDD